MTNQIATQQPSLGVICTSGLCNRLVVLASGLAIAEATGRHFYMLWPSTKACGASFQELFTNEWDIRPVEASTDELRTMANVPYISGLNNRMPDLLIEEKPDILIGSSHSLVQPTYFPHHEKLARRYNEIIEQLEVIPPVQARIDRFRQEHFRSPMIGVHARRGDFIEHRPDVAGNTSALFQAVDKYLAGCPSARIFLATDDGNIGDPNMNSGGVKGLFQARYCDRVVIHPPRSLERDRPEAVQDALIDLWLLRSVDYFVGTSGSSFSNMAVQGRQIPFILCGAPLLWFKRVDQISRLVGIQALFQYFWYRRYGREVPFRHVVVRTSLRFQKIMKRIMPLGKK